MTGDLLRSWGRQVAARTGAPPADVFPGNGRLPSDADEVRRLTRELARAQQEIACLKSAAAYFARASRRATSTPRSRPTGGASRRRPPPGLIQHTDRGCQYASREYRAVLAAHGVRQSMSRKGDCFDNAVAEAFFATLEHELLAGADFATRAEAHHAVAEFIELWYNAERRHGSGSV